VIKKIK